MSGELQHSCNGPLTADVDDGLFGIANTFKWTTPNDAAATDDGSDLSVMLRSLRTQPSTPYSRRLTTRLSLIIFQRWSVRSIIAYPAHGL